MFNRHTFVWTTADGRKMNPIDMTDGHIINVIWHIVKAETGFYPSTVLELFLNEARIRGLPWYKGPVPVEKRYTVMVTRTVNVVARTAEEAEQKARTTTGGQPAVFSITAVNHT